MQQTPLYPIYQKYQARVIDFGGWSLPVQFSGIIAEHLAVRQRVGLFDVSHMGELSVSGPQATEFLDYLLTNRIVTLKPGQVRYSPLCRPDGGTIDDLLVYRLAEKEYLLVVNAANTIKDFEWLQQQAGPFQVKLEDRSAATAQLALQGPRAAELLQKLTAFPLAQLGYYQFAAPVDLNGQPVLLSRTGYTGEDGFEIYLPAAGAISLWGLLLEAGAGLGILPVGLGARDTLRLEAALPLYGHELAESISPLEAGLARFVKLDKADFIGQAALLKQAQTGPPRRLTGLKMLDPGIARTDYPVYQQEHILGRVTSGSFCPALRQNLALVLIANQPLAEAVVAVEIRGQRCRAQLLEPPFYSRPPGGTP